MQQGKWNLELWDVSSDGLSEFIEDNGTSLKMMNMTSTNFQDEHLTQLATCSPNLHSLGIENCDITDAALYTFLDKCSGIVES